MVIEQPWQAGLIDAAQQRQVNLVIFAGGALEDPNRLDTQRSRIFELAGPENVDGLIVGSDFLGHYVGAERIKEFCAQYHPLPIVKYEPFVEGYPTLLFDFYRGMYELITHLVEVHGLHKIGYITGPEQSRSIADRLRAYRDVLAANNIAYDERLVVSGSHSLPTGAEAVRVLLDERGLRPKADIEAIVGFYDLVAVDAMQALQSRGVSVPEDVAVVGFDDDDAAFAASPRLTTVRLPFYEMGHWGVTTLADILDGGEAPATTVLPASLVRRQSCGCQSNRYAMNPDSNVVGQTPSAARDTEWKTASEGTAGDTCGARRSRILEQMLLASGAGNLPSFRRDLEHLLDLFTEFTKHCGATSDQEVLPALGKGLEDIFDGMHGIPYNVDMAYAVLAALQSELCAEAGDEKGRRRMRDLVQVAHAVVSDRIERFLVDEKQQAAHINGLLHDLNQALATALNVADLVEVLARHLPRLGVPACYLSLYEDPQEIGGFASLMLAYDRQGTQQAAGERAPLPNHTADPRRFSPACAAGRAGRAAAFPPPGTDGNGRDGGGPTLWRAVRSGARTGQQRVEADPTSRSSGRRTAAGRRGQRLKITLSFYGHP